MKEVVIGFLGCGNVGGGVWSLLTGFSREIAHRDSLSIRIKRVLVRSLAKKRDIDFPEGVLTDRVEEPLSALIIDGKLHRGDTVVIEKDRPKGVRLRVA